MWSTKVGRLIPKSVLQNHFHVMVKKAAGGYTAHPRKTAKKCRKQLMSWEKHAGKCSEEMLHTCANQIGMFL